MDFALKKNLRWADENSGDVFFSPEIHDGRDFA